MRDVVELYDHIGCPEGPVSLPDSFWLVTDMESGKIVRVGPDDERTNVTTADRPNGLAIDGHGTLWIAESRTPSLLRFPDGATTATAVVTTASGEALLWPNDLCFGPDGTIYFTDSGARIAEFEADSRPLLEREIDGRVIALDPRTYEARILDRGLQFANGIAIGPDDETLYVAETITGLIHSYPLSDIGPGTRRTFGNVLKRSPSSYPKIAGPDGMAFDEDGLLLVAVLTQGTLTVLGTDGEVAEHIPLPDSFATNLAFGGKNGSTILITGCATGSLYGLEWQSAGLSLHRPEFSLTERSALHE